MDTKIYEDQNYVVTIDFYVKPAIISLNSKFGQVVLQVDINRKFISGDKNLFKPFTKWLKSSGKELYDIIWEWESGNDDFALIDVPLVL